MWLGRPPDSCRTSGESELPSCTPYFAVFGRILVRVCVADRHHHLQMKTEIIACARRPPLTMKERARIVRPTIQRYAERESENKAAVLLNWTFCRGQRQQQHPIVFGGLKPSWSRTCRREIPWRREEGQSSYATSDTRRFDLGSAFSGFAGGGNGLSHCRLLASSQPSPARPFKMESTTATSPTLPPEGENLTIIGIGQLNVIRSENNGAIERLSEMLLRCLWCVSSTTAL
jgi:hypothetical protein